MYNCSMEAILPSLVDACTPPIVKSTPLTFTIGGTITISGFVPVTFDATNVYLPSAYVYWMLYEPE